MTAFLFGRSDGIRTHDLLVPNQARYQLRYTPKQLYYYNKALSACQVNFTVCNMPVRRAI